MAIGALYFHLKYMREQDPRGASVEQIEKRREKMADGRRYMIYYTFRPLLEDSSSEGQAVNSINEQQNNAEELGDV